MQFIDFLGTYPSTKMSITLFLVDQIEIFQFLELSTAPKLSPGIFRCYVARVHKRGSKLVIFEGYCQAPLQVQSRSGPGPVTVKSQKISENL